MEADQHPQADSRSGRLGRRILKIYADYIPNFAVLLLFIVSCISTFSGLWWLMQAVETLSSTVGLLVALFLTGGIQLMLLYSISSWMRSRGAIRLLFTAIYIFTVFFSVLFGYAFYFKHLRANSYGWEVLEAESARIVDSAQDYVARWSVLSQKLQDLAGHSARQSEIEDLRGGTCGDQSPSGNGPRAKGRRQDREIFDTYNARFEQLMGAQREELTGLRTRIAGAAAGDLGQVQHELVGFHQKLKGRRLEAEGIWNDLVRYLQVRFPAGRYTIREGEAAYVCADDRMQYLAAAILEERFPDPPAAPEEFKAHDPKIIVMYALQRMLGLIEGGLSAIQAILSGQNAVSASLTDPQSVRTARLPAAEINDSLPLFLGLLVDILIFLAALSSYSQSQSGTRSSNPLTASFERLAEEARSVPEPVRQQLAAGLRCPPESAIYEAQRLIRHFRRRTGIWIFSKDYLLVPSGLEAGRLRTVSSLHFLAAVVEALGLTAGAGTQVRWRSLKEPLPAGLEEVRNMVGDSGGFEYVEVYPLKRGVNEALVREFLKYDRLPVLGSQI